VTKPFAEQLRETMRAAGCRPADFAILLDVPLPTLQRWLLDYDFVPRRAPAQKRRLKVQAKLLCVFQAVKAKRLPIDPSLPLDQIKDALRLVRNEFLID